MKHKYSGSSLIRITLYSSFQKSVQINEKTLYKYIVLFWYTLIQQSL